MKRLKLNFTQKILLSLFGAIALGLFLNITGISESNETIKEVLLNGLSQSISKIFMSLLKLLIVPVIFVSLVRGTAGIGNPKEMGKIGGKTLFLYLITTTLAVSIGLLAGFLLKPGQGLQMPTNLEFNNNTTVSVVDIIVGLFPSNIFSPFYEGKILQVIFLAGLIGLCLNLAGPKAKILHEFFEGLNEVIYQMVHLIIKLTPIGVFFMTLKTFATLGPSALVPLIKYFLITIFVLLFHLLITYSLILRFVAWVNPFLFFKRMKDVLFFAFSTSSSSATIPMTLEYCEKKLGIDPKITSFSIPLGATVNMDGTSLRHGLIVMFVAQAYGIDLNFSQYLMVVLMAILASIGSPGIPSAGLTSLIIVLEQVGLPIELLVMIMGVERILDMFTTVVNVAGDTVVATVLGKWEHLVHIPKEDIALD